MLLPNTLAHLSFELVFLGAYRIFSFNFESLPQSICFPLQRGETLCGSELKCDGGPKQLWILAFGCAFLNP